MMKIDFKIACLMDFANETKKKEQEGVGIKCTDVDIEWYKRHWLVGTNDPQTDDLPDPILDVEQEPITEAKDTPNDAELPISAGEFGEELVQPLGEAGNENRFPSSCFQLSDEEEDTDHVDHAMEVIKSKPVQAAAAVAFVAPKAEVPRSPAKVVRRSTVEDLRQSASIAPNVVHRPEIAGPPMAVPNVAHVPPSKISHHVANVVPAPAEKLKYTAAELRALRPIGKPDVVKQERTKSVAEIFKATVVEMVSNDVKTGAQPKASAVAMKQDKPVASAVADSNANKTRVMTFDELVDECEDPELRMQMNKIKMLIDWLGLKPTVKHIQGTIYGCKASGDLPNGEHVETNEVYGEDPNLVLEDAIKDYTELIRLGQ